MKVQAILNPRAGLAAHRALEALERGRERAFWRRLEVRITGGPGDARQMARDAASAGYDLVVAVGGDGTANEVTEGLLGAETTLGLVPVGSGNGLARTLRIPLKPDRALLALEDGVRRRMDVGMVNGRIFLNLSGAGFDAFVGAAFHTQGQAGGRRGILPYVRLALASALTYEAPTWTLEAAGETLTIRAFIVAFVNGRQYGAGAVVAPRAHLDDGRLDIVIIEDALRLGVIVNSPRLFLGGIERYKHYRHLMAAEAVLTGTGPFAHHRDGEPMAEADRMDVRVAPWALSVLVPRAVAEDPDGPFLETASPLSRSWS